MKITHLLPFFLLFFEKNAVPAQIVVAAEKMNAIYPAVDNLISVAVSDVPDSNLLVTASIGELTKTDNLGHYCWHFCEWTTRYATLTLRDTVANEEVAVMKFRVQKLPSPVPLLGLPHRGCGNGEFKAQGGISAVIQNFDFEIRPEVVSYIVTYLAKDQDPVVYINYGSRWSAEVMPLIQKAKPGDIYFFDHIRYRVGCDPLVREAGGLVFKVK